MVKMSFRKERVQNLQIYNIPNSDLREIHNFDNTTLKVEKYRHVRKRDFKYSCLIFHYTYLCIIIYNDAKKVRTRR